MRINTNVSALRVTTQLNRKDDLTAKSMEKLSSGKKINRSKDDPAGLAMTRMMQRQIRSLDAASQNATIGMSMLDTAESAINEVQSIMQRMRELSVQAANDTNSLEEREAIQYEVDTLSKEVTRISDTTQFNNKNLLDGSMDRRAYSNVPGVEILATTDAVNRGTYILDVSAMPEPAVISIGNLPDKTDNSTLITSAEAGQFIINGVSESIEVGDTYAEAFEKIRRACDAADVLVDETNSELVTKKNGSGAYIDLTSSSASVKSFLAFGAESARGIDASVTVDDSDASAFADSATVQYDGNYVTISDKNGFYMEMYLDPATAATGPVTIDMTDYGTLDLQVGGNEKQMQYLAIPEMSIHSLGLSGLNIKSFEQATNGIAKIDEAINRVSEIRAKLGAYTNALEHTVANLDMYSQSMTSSISVIMDTDMAEEMVEYTNQKVLSQAATSMLSQANARPESVLQLLQ